MTDAKPDDKIDEQVSKFHAKLQESNLRGGSGEVLGRGLGGEDLGAFPRGVVGGA